jgi:acetolactate synthase-1/2/3 large subunit
MKTQVRPQPAPAKAPSGKKMTGADVIVEVLAQEGVDTIFGYSGGAILPTYDAVFRYNAEHAKGGVEPASWPLATRAPAERSAWSW